MSRPSLENLIESEDIGLEVLHPGGLEITAELGRLCRIWKDSRVLDVASGPGESALFLSTAFSCEVTGLDKSEQMVKRAREKALHRGLSVEFVRGDAHNLPFGDCSFDAVISECTVSLLQKERAVSEMVRVARPDGHVGIHDLCWKAEAPESIRARLDEAEGERPETLDGWKGLFERSGLVDVVTIDKSALMAEWSKEIGKKIGIAGRLKIFLLVLRKWGLGGLRSILQSERIFRSEHTGYGIIVGRKP